jgi:hypothetical protein
VRNYSSILNRRVELNVDIYAGDDIERASLVAYCWVENANWFGARDALWVELSRMIAADDSLSLALPQMDISATH